jgi:hypothetical protein
MPGNDGHSDENLPPVLRPENTNPQRLISPNLEGSNPGLRLISNEERLPDMLKVVYIDDDDEARYIAEALGECQEFLLNEDGKPNAEVEMRIEEIKFLLASKCSIKGRFADAYKQAAVGVLTNSFTENRGWQLLSLDSQRSSKFFADGKDESGDRQSRKK